MNSLATKLSLTFILVVIIGVASVSLLVRQETAVRFHSYLEAGGKMYTARVAEGLADLYRESGGWQEAQRVLQGLARGRNDRLVLADTSGRIVADTAGQSIGAGAETLGASGRTPVVVGGKEVGTLHLVTSISGVGSPQGWGRGAMAGQGKERPAAVSPPVQQPPASLEAGYLDSVDRAIAGTALFSGLVAIALGLLVARWITSPLKELSGAAREVAAGKLEHRVHVSSRDELGQVAAAFNTMAESLELNEQARRRMVADIAHELRTPLTIIEGTVDGMLDGVFDPDRGNLESIKEEVALLTKLVADLRTLSLAEAGQLKLDKEPTDLLEFARRSVARVEPIAQRRGIACRVEGNGALPEVEIDPERMGQVLGNLLSNALRHTPESGIVTVAVRGAANVVTLTVADTGEGIPPESLPHLFDRFYRADESRARKSGGSGLGLAIVKQLVEAHGGRVRAESGPGQGSRFVIELPAANAAA